MGSSAVMVLSSGQLPKDVQVVASHADFLITMDHLNCIANSGECPFTPSSVVHNINILGKMQSRSP